MTTSPNFTMSHNEFAGQPRVNIWCDAWADTPIGSFGLAGDWLAHDERTPDFDDLTGTSDLRVIFGGCSDPERRHCTLLPLVADLPQQFKNALQRTLDIDAAIVDPRRRQGRRSLCRYLRGIDVGRLDRLIERCRFNADLVAGGSKDQPLQWQHEVDGIDRPFADGAVDQIKTLYNCREAEISEDYRIWIADPQAGHWLDDDDMARIARALEAGDI